MTKPLTNNYEDYFIINDATKFPDYYLGNGRYLKEEMALAMLMQHGWVELQFGINALDGPTVKATISGLDIPNEQTWSDVLGHLLSFHDDGVESWVVNNGGQVKQNREHLNSLSYDLADFYENDNLNILAAVQRLVFDDVINVSAYDEYENGDCTTLSVNANDVWAWAASMSHELPNESEIESLLHYHFDGKPYSTLRWLCYIENEQPQSPWVPKLIEAGVWDETMKSLRPNGSDRNMFWMFSSIPELGLPSRKDLQI